MGLFEAGAFGVGRPTDDALEVWVVLGLSEQHQG